MRRTCSAVFSVGLLFLPSPDKQIQDPWFTLMEIVILAIAPAMVAFTAGIHLATSAQRKPLALLGVIFMSLCAAFTSSVRLGIDAQLPARDGSYRMGSGGLFDHLDVYRLLRTFWRGPYSFLGGLVCCVCSSGDWAHAVGAPAVLCEFCSCLARAIRYTVSEHEHQERRSHWLWGSSPGLPLLCMASDPNSQATRGRPDHFFELIHFGMPLQALSDFGHRVASGLNSMCLRFDLKAFVSLRRFTRTKNVLSKTDRSNAGLMPARMYIRSRSRADSCQ